MSVSMLLLWFPIVLAVGVAGRLLGPGRGFAFGFLCALFWVSLAFAIAGGGVWAAPWGVPAMVAGVSALTLVGGWSGQGGAGPPVRSPVPGVRDEVQNSPRDTVERHVLLSIGRALGRFDECSEEAVRSSDPWADFGEYLRSILSDSHGATHVQPFRVVGDGTQVEALHGAGPLESKTRLSANDGRIAKLLMGAGSHAKTAEVGPGESCGDSQNAWSFAIMRGRERLGAVSVGTLDVSPEAHPECARAMERLVAEVWAVFIDRLEARSASTTDAASTLATRDALMRDANLALRESFALGEPVAIAVLAVRGLRGLTDAGRWEVAEDVLHTIGGVMKQRVRLDDCIGRIDESRVVWLLRRVDIDLAKLVVGQLTSHVAEAIRSSSAVPETVRVDCGVACCGPEDAPLRSLLVAALAATEQARKEGRLVFVEDVKPVATSTAPKAIGGAL